jgi:8-oxo-dGTP pyrophosphatase MutT (NUDIX family)
MKPSKVRHCSIRDELARRSPRQWAPGSHRLSDSPPAAPLSPVVPQLGILGRMAAHDEPPMRTTGSRVVYRNNWMAVREDNIVFADGTESIYGVLDKADYAIVIAAEDGLFHLVEQYRYACSKRSLEFPMGGWPAGKTGTAEELARAELSEETGLTAANWVHLGHLVQSSGYSPQAFDIYLATELTPGVHNREHTEGDMVHRPVTEQQFRSLIRDGTITDGPTIAAYAMLQLHRDEIADRNPSAGA